MTRSGDFSPKNATHFGYFSANLQKFWAIFRKITKVRAIPLSKFWFWHFSELFGYFWGHYLVALGITTIRGSLWSALKHSAAWYLAIGMFNSNIPLWNCWKITNAITINIQLSIIKVLIAVHHTCPEPLLFRTYSVPNQFSSVSLILMVMAYFTTSK